MKSASDGVGGGNDAALVIPGLGAAVFKTLVLLGLVDSTPAYFARIACLLARRSAKVSSTVFVLSKSKSISASGSSGFATGGVDRRVEGLGDVEITGVLPLLLGADTLQNPLVYLMHYENRTYSPSSFSESCALRVFCFTSN